jgi:hypothetical protein
VAERSACEVLADHWRRRKAGDLAGDLEHNYAADIVLLCSYGVVNGCDALRESAQRLGLQIPNARYDYLTQEVYEDIGFLEWRAESDRVRVHDGADSYVVRDGRIRVQSIHYRLEDKGAGGDGA